MDDRSIRGMRCTRWSAVIIRMYGVGLALRGNDASTTHWVRRSGIGLMGCGTRFGALKRFLRENGSIHDNLVMWNPSYDHTLQGSGNLRLDRLSECVTAVQCA